MKSCGGRLKIFRNTKVDAKPEVMPMNNVLVFMMMLISLALLRYLNTPGLAETVGETARKTSVLPKSNLQFNGKI